MTVEEQPIIVYGTTWCFDSRRARKVLDELNIAYKWIDIDKTTEARKIVEEINKGYRSVPTIIFPDGSILVEPSNDKLRAKLFEFTQET